MLRVFEISRMTNHNGPGIRTLVHFKGCPLRCKWCSTPESQLRNEELGYKVSKCIRCGACVQICPENAIGIGPEGIHIDRKKCIECFTCVKECYAHALTRIGRTWSVDELVKEIRKDELFFRKSGGGVTFSGGEPLMFADEEMVELFSKVKSCGISIGIDTTGYVSWDKIESILPYTDFFLWDLKIMDSLKHRELTGVSNELILENLKRLENCAEKYGIRVYIRCVQIPGMTDFDENLIKTCEFIKDMKCIQELDLINFHHFGKKRYEFIDRTYDCDGLESLSDDVMEEKKKLVEQYGIICNISM